MTRDGRAPDMTTAMVDAMVDALHERAGLTRPDVADAFRAVPRHVFVPGTPLAEAYTYDAVIPTHFDSGGMSISSSSAPNIMATMLEQLDARPGMRVLEIGAGTGFNAGLLGHLVGDAGEVKSIDLDAPMVEAARSHLAAAGIGNVEVRTGDGWLGAPDDAPFDRVIATVGVWEISPHWFEQLRPGGVLVVPLWLRPGAQVSVALVRDDDGLHSVALCGCGFMRLRGPHAGPEAHVLVPGWRVHVGAETPREWIAGFEHATPERVALLRELLAQTPEITGVRLPAVGWTTRLALDEPGAIELASRTGPRRYAFGLFSPDRRSLAVFEAGRALSFGEPHCGERLRARLPGLAPLRVDDLDIRARLHPAPVPADGWLLERPHFDLVVQERRANDGT